ncbi:unnamed protein product [Hydatigera taeniaeformis]|uniref:Kinesin motor domain-containing protein n=1 Tax=Hydatigena taeniaeformis TaxID=6205 RepID=A0A0R3WUJ4_HYDTA|nr:unnamed protein product [Hydatigera taeniaeformis]
MEVNEGTRSGDMRACFTTTTAGGGGGVGGGGVFISWTKLEEVEDEGGLSTILTNMALLTQSTGRHFILDLLCNAATATLETIVNGTEHCNSDFSHVYMRCPP